MKLSRTYAFLSACAASLVYGSPTPIASPAITPGPLLPRAIETFAWTSNTTIGDETVYSPWKNNPEKSTYTSSGDYFRRCAVDEVCTMFTECSNGYLVGTSTSKACGEGSEGEQKICGNHVMFESLGAEQTYSWFVCDTKGQSYYTFYRKEPAQPTGTSAGSPASTDASTTASTASETASGSSSGSSSKIDTTSTASPSATSDAKFSVNIGGIAGGVIGGVIGLAAIGLGVFFFMRRKKRKALYAPPADHQPFNSPAPAYTTPYGGGFESKPVGVADGGYPQGPYDPHATAYGGAAEMSAPPPAGAAEMPASVKYAHMPTDVPMQDMGTAELAGTAPYKDAPQELPAQR